MSTPLDIAAQFSRYSRNLLDKAPQIRDELHDAVHQPCNKSTMQDWLQGEPISDETSLKTRLRQLRERAMVWIMARDLAGLADLNEVVSSVTALAEVAVETAYHHLYRQLTEQYGVPRAENGDAQQLIVIGMGKLGGEELNVSSDIDLIFVYPEDGQTDGSTALSNHEFFTRLGRKLISAISEHTADGFVFRVDMRLRPYGDSGPLVCSFAMLEEYFITQGREWERYAWVKAKPLTGARHGDLDKLVKPFVYRKYLDFGAFGSMRDLHAQIRREVARRELADNIKLGPGGIREVEFIGQVFQLIRGGKLPQLQLRSTRAVLPLLARQGWLPQTAVDELLAAYTFLRNLEHRLQYLDDQQTQNLTRNPDDLAAIAGNMGFPDSEAFLQELERHRQHVTRHFEQVFVAPQSDQTQHPLRALWPDGLSDCSAKLAQLGFSDPASACQHLQALADSGRYKGLPAANRQRFDALMPPLLEMTARQNNPDLTLERVLRLMEAIARRGSYLALLLEYPQTLHQVVRMMSASQWAAEYLTRYPILLDELLDARLLYAEPDWPTLQRELDQLLQQLGDDTERQMDALRQFKNAQTFHLLAQDLAGLLPLEKLSDHLSALADVLLAVTLQHCWQQLKTRHRESPAFAIIGYGKLGGKELGYASDLDIIFLYQDDDERAAEIYARLAQRLNGWLNSMTSAGLLYETDLRLRPNGAAGLLVSTVEAFDVYQEKDAWTWEHQALTRARFITGMPEIGRQFDTIRQRILSKQRDLPDLRADVLSMRQKMLDGHPNHSDLFDLKHDRGGIIDVEFIVQYLILAHSWQHPELTGNIGNLALLGLAGKLGLIPAELATRCSEAYRSYRQRQHQLRLQGDRYARLSRNEIAEHIKSVTDLWSYVFV